MEPKTGKKIVSKGEYAKAQGKRAGLRLWAGLLHLLSGLFALSAASCALAFLIGIFFGRNKLLECLISLALFVCLGAVAWLLRERGRANIRRARELDAGVPLTRANTADLPTPDTLVRASSEPLQAQEAVLLRAAAEGQETHAEQLVRASVRQE